MQLNILFIVALAGIAGVNANKVEVDVTPVQKVVALLQGMLEKGKKAKGDEKTAFAKSSQWCADTDFEKTMAIKDGKENVKQLASKISKANSDITSLTKKVNKLDADIATFTGDLKGANDLRKTQNADFKKTNKDLEESINAVGRAIETMKAQEAPTAQAAASLLQVASIPHHVKKQLAAFLQQGKGDENVLLQDLGSSLDMGAPAVHALESSSGGIVSMLKGLQTKFMEEQTKLQSDESNAKGAHALLTQDLKASISQTTDDKSKKTITKSKRTSDKIDKSEDKAQADKMLAADEKTLAKLKADCSMEATNFDSRQKLRGEELVTLEKAIDIINTEVSGRADKHLPKLLQDDQQATSFAGLRSANGLEAQLQARNRVSQFLKAQAHETNSRVLLAIGQRVAKDPMKKVKKMIQDMIVKLNEQANDEADAKGVCDTELAENKMTRVEKTDEVTKLTAEIEGLTAAIAKLDKEVEKLTEQVAGLDKALTSKTTIRNEEHAKNKDTVADAKAAQSAVASALKVLKDFYQKAGEATVLIQDGAPKSQGGEGDEAFKGDQGASTGVIGTLEVIQSDFARLEADTTSSEDTAQKKFDQFSQETKVDKKDKETESAHKAKKKVKKGRALDDAQDDLKGNQKALTAALTVFDKLKEQCMAKPESYEDKVAKRKLEISNLQSALKMLTPAAAAAAAAAAASA